MDDCVAFLFEASGYSSPGNLMMRKRGERGGG